MKLGELKLGELLETPPPGLDEALAISKVCIICYAYLAHCFAQYIFFVFLASLLTTNPLAR
jgi:arsenite-transporting ATPase